MNFRHSYWPANQKWCFQGFFRRTISNQLAYRQCPKNGTCKILRMNRNRCQFCRFKKCMEVGMSRDSVKYGRIPKKQKARMIQDRKEQWWDQHLKYNIWPFICPRDPRTEKLVRRTSLICPLVQNLTRLSNRPDSKIDHKSVQSVHFGICGNIFFSKIDLD